MAGMPVPDRRRTSAEQDQAVADRAQTAAVSCPIEASLRPTPRLGRRRREKAGIPVTPRALASAMSASMGACCAACRGPARNASCRAPALACTAGGSRAGSWADCRTRCRGAPRTSPAGPPPWRRCAPGGILVDVERVVLPDDADLVAVYLPDLLEGRTDPPAERSLEVGELDDRDGGAGGALHRRAFGLDGIHAVGIRPLPDCRLCGLGRKLGQAAVELREAVVQALPELASLLPVHVAEQDEHGHAGQRRPGHHSRQEGLVRRRWPCGRRSPTRAGIVAFTPALTHRPSRSLSLWTSLLPFRIRHVIQSPGSRGGEFGGGGVTGAGDSSRGCSFSNASSSFWARSSRPVRR